jgi:hypothetical protein
MRVFQLPVFYALLWVSSAYSSEAGDQSSITQDFGHILMEGLIDESRPVTAHFWFETGELSYETGMEGKMRLSGAIQESSPGRVIRFQGLLSEESDTSSLAWMSGTHEGCRVDEEMGHFDVKWDKGTETEPAVLSGKLEKVNGEQKSTIYLRQITPPGEAPLDYHRFRETYERKRGDSTLDRELSIVFPQVRSDHPAHETVNAVIRHWAYQSLVDFTDKPDVAHAAPSLPQIESALRAELPDRAQPEKMNIEQQEAVQVSHLFKVLHNRGGLLCLRMTMTQYLGGAHQMYSSRHLVFDLTTGSTLKLNDLLIDGWRRPLTQMANEDLRVQFGLKEGEPLISPGPLQEKFKLNDNLFMSDEGLGFYFDPYEIASFSLGPVITILPLQKIGHLIRRDSVLWGIQNSKAQ